MRSVSAIILLFIASQAHAKDSVDKAVDDTVDKKMDGLVDKLLGHVLDKLVDKAVNKLVGTTFVQGRPGMMTNRLQLPSSTFGRFQGLASAPDRFNSHQTASLARPYAFGKPWNNPIVRGDGDVEERVKKIIVENLNVEADKVKPDAKFIDDLGADSLDTVELLMALEEELGTEIPEEEAQKITTVQDVIDYAKKGDR